jgi:diacylglycerol diphosphate phosphatase / phosphatidate phosphatase
MTFLSLFLAGITGAWLFRQTLPGRTLTSSRIAKLTLTLLPIAYAIWVAVSRVEDYVGAFVCAHPADVADKTLITSQRHHKEDVLVGSLLGALTAGTCYLIYWPNPFIFQDNAAARHLSVSRPRHVYGDMSNMRPTAGEYEYELAGIERTESHV